MRDMMIFIIILIIYDIAVSFRIPEYAEIVKRRKSPFKPLIYCEPQVAESNNFTAEVPFQALNRHQGI